MSTTISVIIICKNEEINISDCIKSAYFANEILVLDSGSTDNTVQLAKAAGAKVIETDWPGYGRQKTAPLRRPLVIGYFHLMPMKELHQHWQPKFFQK